MLISWVVMTLFILFYLASVGYTILELEKRFLTGDPAVFSKLNIFLVGPWQYMREYLNEGVCKIYYGLRMLVSSDERIEVAMSLLEEEEGIEDE